jgi:hypothetical protein
MMAQQIVVSDRMQTHYEYLLIQPTGDCFAPEFQPQLSPQKMLELGVFGGKYMTDCIDEFPKQWFKKARLSPKFHDPEINYFRVNASQPLSSWRSKGWIYPEDPRGWFQWYCRYYMGRRCEDDERQIKRWKNMRRHIAQLKRNCEPWDMNCRPKQRQALLHWAYDSRDI